MFMVVEASGKAGDSGEWKVDHDGNRGRKKSGSRVAIAFHGGILAD